ncbi:hypothetical protein BV22DRAFT_1157503 [Leucogyrophana mollusca]|uniref:Uncharacterized protein n=1 Tax=Leucogyrophana mollusca TaxID=85980 RepID=A0ACB8BLC1_9AGAM|nr:hypothetical protein BV22DRAFT_1157503 [Leucogyrophana mollusca]
MARTTSNGSTWSRSVWFSTCTYFDSSTSFADAPNTSNQTAAHKEARNLEFGFTTHALEGTEQETDEPVSGTVLALKTEALVAALPVPTAQSTDVSAEALALEASLAAWLRRRKEQKLKDVKKETLPTPPGSPAPRPALTLPPKILDEVVNLESSSAARRRRRRQLRAKKLADQTLFEPAKASDPPRTLETRSLATFPVLYRHPSDHRTHRPNPPLSTSLPAAPAFPTEFDIHRRIALAEANSLASERRTRST